MQAAKFGYLRKRERCVIYQPYGGCLGHQWKRHVSLLKTNFCPCRKLGCATRYLGFRGEFWSVYRTDDPIIKVLLFSPYFRDPCPC